MNRGFLLSKNEQFGTTYPLCYFRNKGLFFPNNGTPERIYVVEFKILCFHLALLDIFTSGPCNIDIKDTSFSLKQFLKEYSTSRPFIVRDSSNNDLFRALARK